MCPCAHQSCRPVGGMPECNMDEGSPVVFMSEVSIHHCNGWSEPGIIQGMGSANERRHYVTPSLID